jgi:hypothetical protein
MIGAMEARPTRVWSFVVVLFVLLAPAGCGGRGADSGIAALPATAAPQKTTPLCEALYKGAPTERVKKHCSGTNGKLVNAALCYDPTYPSRCTVPKEAVVRLTERGYKGKIIASDKTKLLPSKIVHSPAFLSGLCGDKGKSPSFDPMDIIDFSPAKRTGSPADFTITDEGPRDPKQPSQGTSTCYVVFYDQSDQFVEFLVVMLSD